MAGKMLLPIKKDGQKELARAEPFGFFDEFEREMERMFDRWGAGWWRPARLLRRPTPLATTWTPRLDVFEKGGNLVVKADLPGMKPEDVQVELEENDLVIKGEMHAEEEVKEEDFYRMERHAGTYYRRLTLPFEAPAETMQATFKDGVLEVTIPKPVETQPEPRKIPVTTT